MFQTSTDGAFFYTRTKLKKRYDDALQKGKEMVTIHIRQYQINFSMLKCRDMLVSDYMYFFLEETHVPTYYILLGGSHDYSPGGQESSCLPKANIRPDTCFESVLKLELDNTRYLQLQPYQNTVLTTCTNLHENIPYNTKITLFY